MMAMGLRRALTTARAWKRDESLRGRLTNIGHLLSGNFVSGIIGLGAIALTARAIGPHNYGILALAITFTRAVERLVTFQSWQPIIKFGAEVSGPEHRDDLRQLLKFGFLLDGVGAVAAFIVAVTLTLTAGSLMGWNHEVVTLVAIYCTTLLFNINGTPTAILRLNGRYQAAAYGPVGNALARVALCGIGIWMKADLAYFVLVWMGSQILGSLTFLAFSIQTLRQGGVRNVLSAPVKGVTRRFEGLWSFAWQSNLSLTIRSSAQQLDTLLVGALAGPVAAGFYHIAKQVGRMAQQIGFHAQSVLYPDVARLWATRHLKEFRRAIIQVEAMLAGFGVAVFLGLLVLAEPIVRLTAGPQFTAAAPLMIVQGAAVSLMLAGFPSRSALLAMGQQRNLLKLEAGATIAFHVTALTLIPLVGAMGANFAHMLLGLISVTGVTLLLRRKLRAETPGHGSDPLPQPPAGTQEAAR